MKILRKAILVAVSLSMVTLFSSCEAFSGPQADYHKASKVILQELHRRYGEDFAIKSIGGINKLVLSEDYKAYCCPKSDPKREFNVTMAPDFNAADMSDDYTNLIMQDKYTKYAQGIANTIWKDGIYVQSDFNCCYLTYNEKDISLQSFFEKNIDSGNTIQLRILLNDALNPNVEINAANIIKYADRLSNDKCYSIAIYTIIVDKNTFTNLDKFYKDIIEHEGSGKYPNCFTKIDEGKVDTTQTELVKELNNGTKGDYFE